MRMKTSLSAALGCFALVVSTQLFAGCYEGGQFVSCEFRACGQQEGSPYITECMCSDPSVIRHNPCLTTAEFCRAYGNIGADTTSW